MTADEPRGFCPRCGDPVDRSQRAELPGERGRQQRLCDDCFFDSFDLVEAPDRLTVRVCGSCGAVQKGNQWEDVEADDPVEVAINAVSNELGAHVDADDVQWAVEPERVDETTIRIHGQFRGTIRETVVEESVTVPVTLSRGTCSRCGRIAGGSYGAIVQVRATDRPVAPIERDRVESIAHETVEEASASGNRDAYITEAGEIDDGLDVKVSTPTVGDTIAKRVVAELGGDYDDHETLVTQDEDGQDVYRVTYAIRLPPYRPGDVIDPDDSQGPVLVRSVTGGLRGIELASGATYTADNEDHATTRKLGTIDDGVETTLVAVPDERAVQVLDPETFETVTIDRPSFLETDTDTVRVFKSHDGVHLLPHE